MEMSFLEQLKKVPGVKMRLGLNLAVDKGEDGVWYFRPNWTSGGKEEDYILFGLHYFSNVLARYPKSDSHGYEMATTLRHIVVMIVNEGVWPGSDLVKYAGLTDRVRIGDMKAAPGGEEVDAALVMTRDGVEPSLMLAEPVKVGDEGLVFSVVVVLQGVVEALGDRGVELFDRALRYFNSFLDEGAACSDLPTATSMANRAWQMAVKG